MSRSYNDRNRRQQRPGGNEHSSSRSRMLQDIDLVEREMEMSEDIEAGLIPPAMRRPARHRR